MHQSHAPPPPQTVQCTVLKVIPFSLPCIHLHTDVLYFWVNLSVNTNFSYEAIWVKFIFISFFSLFPLSLLFNYAYTLYIVIFLHVDSLLYNNACIHDMNTCTPFSLLSPPSPPPLLLFSFLTKKYVHTSASTKNYFPQDDERQSQFYASRLI